MGWRGKGGIREPQGGGGTVYKRIKYRTLYLLYFEWFFGPFALLYLCLLCFVFVIFELMDALLARQPIPQRFANVKPKTERFP